MQRLNWGPASVVLACLLAITVATLPVLRSRAARAQGQLPSKARVTAQSNADDALRFNTLGVAYMNQQKFADAQKHFERALAADATFNVARLNLGIALIRQQQLDTARDALGGGAPSAAGSIRLVQPWSRLQRLQRNGKGNSGVPARNGAYTRG